MNHGPSIMGRNHARRLRSVNPAIPSASRPVGGFFFILTECIGANVSAIRRRHSKSPGLRAS